MELTRITTLIRQNHRIVVSTLFTIFIIIFLVIPSVYSPSDQNTNNILVLAASSLSDALNELQKDFGLENDIVVNISYGGSQMLAQQISSGAPADIFISAGESPVIFLSNKNLVETPSIGILSNQLVLATKKLSNIQIASLGDLKTPAIKNIGIADPDLAPAGAYAKEALNNIGIWNDIQPKLVFGSDARSVLAYLESGNVDAALIYATDAKVSAKVDVWDIIEAKSYSKIVYPAAIIDTTSNRTSAIKFLDFLRNTHSQEIFRKYGFEPVK